MVNVGLELDDDVAAGLYHLRDNRNVALSAWVQGLIRLGLPADRHQREGPGWPCMDGEGVGSARTDPTMAVA